MENSCPALSESHSFVIVIREETWSETDQKVAVWKEEAG